jgi:hypothetical protein
MPSKAPIISTKFCIEGEELDPSEFTQIVGVQPNRTGKKGELSPNPMAAKIGVRIPQTFWCIEVERNSYSMDEGIQAVLAQIWPHREKILEYVKGRPSLEMGVNTTIHMDEDRPVYEISLDSIKKLAELGCPFMLNDIYPMQ